MLNSTPSACRRLLTPNPNNYNYHDSLWAVRQLQPKKLSSCSFLALRTCRRLLALNPNNHRYHDGLRAALQLQPDAQGRWTEQQRRGLTSLYDALAKEHPASSAVKRIPLGFKVCPQQLKA